MTVFFTLSVAHNDVTAECGTTPEQPFAPLVDSAAALAAHERMPAGRVEERMGWEPLPAETKLVASRRKRQAARYARLRAEAVALGVSIKKYMRSKGAA